MSGTAFLWMRSKQSREKIRAWVQLCLTTAQTDNAEDSIRMTICEENGTRRKARREAWHLTQAFCIIIHRMRLSPCFLLLFLRLPVCIVLIHSGGESKIDYHLHSHRCSCAAGVYFLYSMPRIQRSDELEVDQSSLQCLSFATSVLNCAHHHLFSRSACFRFLFEMW